MTQTKPTKSHIIVSVICYQWPRIRPAKGMSNRRLQRPGRVQGLLTTGLSNAGEKALRIHI